MYYVGDKTLNAKDYVKINADKLLIGKGKVTSYVLTNLKELREGKIEASGNGIWAISRALDHAKQNKLGQNELIILTINKKNADSFYADVSTGFNSSMGNFTQACVGSFIMSKAIVPHPNNTKHNITYFKNKAKGDDADSRAKSYVNRRALPSIKPEVKEVNKKIQIDKPATDLRTKKLIGINPINTSSFIDKIKGKKLDYNNEFKATQLAEEFANTFAKDHINRVAGRYEKYLLDTASEAGVDSTVFTNLLTYIDSWKKSELTKIKGYANSCKKEIKKALSAGKDKGTVTKPLSGASAKVIKGTVGQ